MTQPPNSDVEKAMTDDKAALGGVIDRISARVYMRQADRLETALRNMMAAYERRVRTDCTPEQLQKQPWRCAEYIAAEQAIAACDEPSAGPDIAPRKALLPAQRGEGDLLALAGAAINAAHKWGMCQATYTTDDDEREFKNAVAALKDAIAALHRSTEGWQCVPARDTEPMGKTMAALNDLAVSSVFSKEGGSLFKDAAELIGELICLHAGSIPVADAVEHILDDKSAWIAAPNKEVAQAVALRAVVAAQQIAQETEREWSAAPAAGAEQGWRDGERK